MKMRRLPLLACGLIVACGMTSCYSYYAPPPPPPQTVVVSKSPPPPPKQVVTNAPVRREVVYVQQPAPVVYHTRYYAPSYGYCPPPRYYAPRPVHVGFSYHRHSGYRHRSYCR